MFVKRALGIGLLALTGVAVAQQGLRLPQAKPAPPGGNLPQLVGRMYSEAEIAELKVDAAQVALQVKEARVPTRKTPTAELQVFDDATGRILFKVADDRQVLVQGDGSMLSLTNRDVDPIQQVAAEFGLAVTPAINKHASRLVALQRKATVNSGKGQPWLSGMLYADGPEEVLLDAARALNDLNAVEWVEIETQLRLNIPQACCLDGGQCQVVEPDFCTDNLGGTPIIGQNTCGTDGLCGACCYSNGTCIEPVTDLACLAAPGRTWQGGGSSCDGQCGACCAPDDSCHLLYTPSGCEQAYPGGNQIPGELDCANVNCEELEDADCGVGYTGDCFDPAGNGSIYCNDLECCELVCEIDPYCCEEDNPFASWDSICAAEAIRYCGGGDVCASPNNASCFESLVCDSGGTQVGCNNADCCNAVCSVDPNCCDTSTGCWDSQCVLLALELCEDVAPGPNTPDYIPIQGYRTPEGYNPVPPEMVPYLPMIGGQPLYGYTGEGFNLMGGEPWVDDNPANGVYDPGEDFEDWDGNLVYTGVGDGSDVYNGLYGLAENLLVEYGVDALGEGNMSLGKTIKIAVIEWGYWEGHEDLVVTTEPGQTIIAIPQISAPDHGTACLSIINARPNGIGMTGIAPDAEAYFFPLTSVEEGPRQFNAWTSALETLEPGDVISCSYGPGPAIANLNNSGGTWTMIRMAADTGITCCIAAGNDCFNLDGAPDLGDSGGIVVGASSPGFPWYRLTFSNYYQGGDGAIDRSNVVHMRAWGEAIASDGYGVIYNGDPEPLRSYMPIFGGTSGATPQIAGAVACLQGLAKQFYGIPLTPEQIRGALRSGWLPPDPCSRSRLNCGFPDFCTWDTDPTEGPNLIGPYPCLAGGFGCAAEQMFNQGGFGGNPLVDEIEVLVGTLLYGNVFSIKADDGNNLVISSALQTPSGIDFSSRSTIMTGHTTDVLIRAHTEFPRVDEMTIAIDSFVSGGAGVVLLYLYSFDYGQWLVAGVGFVDSFDDPDEISAVFAITNARQFIRSGDRQVQMRIQTISSPYGPDYEVFHDLIFLEAGANPQVPSDGP